MVRNRLPEEGSNPRPTSESRRFPSELADRRRLSGHRIDGEQSPERDAGGDGVER